MGDPAGAGEVRLDRCARSEPYLDGSASIRVVRVSVRTVDGDAGEAAARAQGEALQAIARLLGLLDEEGE